MMAPPQLLTRFKYIFFSIGVPNAFDVALSNQLNLVVVYMHLVALLLKVMV